MPGPTDYTLKAEDPTAAFAKWYGVGNAVSQNYQSGQAQFAAQQAAEAAKAAEDEKARQEEERQAKIAEAFKTKDYATLGLILPPEQAKAVREGVSMMDSATAQDSLNFSGQVLAATRVRNIDVAKQLMATRAQARRNAGDEEGAKFIETWANTLDHDPAALENFFGYTISQIPGGDKVLEGINKLDTTNRGNAAAAGDRSNTDADTELKKAQAEKLRAELEADRTPESKPLSPDAQKIMNAAVDSVGSSEMLATQAENLASEFTKLRPPSGWVGNAVDWLKKVSGGQDKFTSLKQEYVKLRNTDVLKNLPPGVASDKDIEIALKAFPDENANPDQIASFLAGTAKLQRHSASVNKAKSQWLNQNGSLGPARVEFTAAGVPVKKGMNFWDLTAAIPVPNVVSGAAPATTPTATPASPPATAPAANPAGTTPAAKTFSVTAPNGKVYTFKDQASLDAFKKEAGISG